MKRLANKDDSDATNFDPNGKDMYGNTLTLWCERCDAFVNKHSKHCMACNRCTLIFDHHCKWLNNCIGRINYSQFFILIITFFISQVAFIAIPCCFTALGNWSFKY